MLSEHNTDSNQMDILLAENVFWNQNVFLKSRKIVKHKSN